MSSMNTNTTNIRADYENSSFGDTTVTCKEAFQSFTAYSRLQPSIEPTSEERVNGEDASYSG